MQRVLAILLALCFAALGTGAVEHLHNAHHAAEDAQVLAASRSAGEPQRDLPGHDESNCAFHLQLHLPALPFLIAPPTVALGLLIGSALFVLPGLMPRRLPLRIDCRGPPRG